MREIIFRQYDSRWTNLPYPTKSYSFGNNGCGCCSVTHLIAELPEYIDYTPADVRPYMVEQGFATKGHGTLHSGITKTLKHYGLASRMHGGMQSAFNDLSKMPKGRRAGIILFRSGSKGRITWTSSGHYVAYLDYKVDSKGNHWFYTKDSGARKNDGWFCYETQMRGLIKEIWTVELPEPKKGKYFDVGKTYVVVSGLNVRTGGAVTYRKVGYLEKGSTVECLQTSKDGRWIRHGKYRWSCGISLSGKKYIE